MAPLAMPECAMRCAFSASLMFNLSHHLSLSLAYSLSAFHITVRAFSFFSGLRLHIHIRFGACGANERVTNAFTEATEQCEVRVG